MVVNSGIKNINVVEHTIIDISKDEANEIGGLPFKTMDEIRARKQ